MESEKWQENIVLFVLQKLARDDGLKVVVFGMTVTIWIWSLILAMPPLFGWGSFKPGLAQLPRKYFQ